MRKPNPASTKLSGLLLPLLLVACGSPQEPAAPDSAPASDAAALEGSAPAPEASEPIETAETAGTDMAGDAEPAADDKNKIRDVVYKMVPGGLEIEVDGVKFTPKATPVKLKGGAWGVKISMDAEGVGDDTRYILKPKGGVLAFAGSVNRKGNFEEFGDRREGDDAAELLPGTTLSFESTWPKDGAKNALWWGNELKLEVGLWGLGASSSALRPVKHFFTLRMVAGNKPQPVIQPPKSAE
jgi:hypothetical protein